MAEYYSPKAKKRWCLSLYDNVGQHALGVFPQATMDAWKCDICGSKSGRGFEATCEILPRLNEIKFGSGVIDELLFLDLPRECRYPSGIMVLEYGKAIQESVYEQLRVVREGQLRIIFTHDLKILSWEFCARRHEELLPRRLVAPQVNQLVQVAQKCQSTIAESGSDGVSEQDLQTNSNMVLTAGRHLARSLELQSLNDLGFSKRYVRCLQISEVVSTMKDLIDFCSENKLGAIDGLKNFPRRTNESKLQMQKMQEMEQLASAQGLPTDRNTLNKLMAMQSGLNNQMNSNNSHHMVNHGGGTTLSGSAQAAMAMNNYQNLMRQNSMNSNQQEPSSSYNNSNPPSPFRAGSIGGSVQQQQQRATSINQRTPPHPSQGNNNNQALEQHMIQQLLQEMSNNGGPSTMQPENNVGRNGFGNNVSVASPSMGGGSVSGLGPGPGPSPSRSNSFKVAPSNSDSSNQRGGGAAPDLSHNFHLGDDMVDDQDIANDFTGSGFFNSDFDDYSWKG